MQNSQHECQVTQVATGLYMDFDEALRCFAKVDLDELPESAKLKKKGAKKAPLKPKSKPD